MKKKGGESMLYIASDLHGEYRLFRALLDKIAFSSSDRMIVCGDVIDKGEEPVRLLQFVLGEPNIDLILGNHEAEFLKYYRALMREHARDFGKVLSLLSEYFPTDGALLDWETVDALETLPLYMEEEDFLCVHAGAPIGADGHLLPLSEASAEELVYDRRFKDPYVRHEDARCVFFGHTETAAIAGEPRILVYRREKGAAPRSVRDFCKIHLDTGAWSRGVMGCFCVDTLKAHYVRKKMV